MVRAVQVSLPVALVGLWQLASTYVKGADAFVSTPWEVLTVLRTWFLGPDYVWVDAFATLRVAAMGLVIGCTAAVGVALVLAQVEVLGRFLAPFIGLANVLPKVSLIPLFILWFGIGDTSKVAFVSAGIFFIVFYNVLASLMTVASEQRDHLRVLGASRSWLVRELLLPAAWGSLISSIRLSVAFALLGSVLAEMMASNNGLGFRLAHGQATVTPSTVVAAIVIIAAVGVLLDRLLAGLDRRLAAWRRA